MAEDSTDSFANFADSRNEAEVLSGGDPMPKEHGWSVGNFFNALGRMKLVC
jgi:hypothetical protein